MGKVSVLMRPDEAVRGAGGASGAQVIAVGAAAEEPAAKAAGYGAEALGRGELARAMSLFAGVMRDSGGLEKLDGLLGRGDESAWRLGEAVHAFDLESVEAANLRLVSQLIVAGALRRAESRGCHRRRDATVTAERAWHTLLRWDGERLVVSEETL